MVKVYIDMDQGFCWWPVLEDDPIHAMWKREMTMEVSAELLAEHKIAYEAYQAMQEKLEALYRIQNGYEPHPSQVAPEYKLLKENKDE
jgi:hypothetical protein